MMVDAMLMVIGGGSGDNVDRDCIKIGSGGGGGDCDCGGNSGKNFTVAPFERESTFPKYTMTMNHYYFLLMFFPSIR